MIKGSFIKVILFSAIMLPLLGRACVDGNVATRKLDRKYAGITALPVARYLGLDDTCNGRRLYKISMWASTSAGPGLATLIVNGVPVGVSEQVTGEVTEIDFPLDPDLNHMGSEVGLGDMEIRLSGDFYIDHIEASLSAADDGGGDDGDPWDHYGHQTKVGVTAAMGDDWQVSTFKINACDNPLIGFLMIARDAAFELGGEKVVFTDGTEQRYSGDWIDKDDAREINFHCQKDVASISVKGKSGVCGEKAKLDIRALH